MNIEQYVMAYEVDHDRLRAILPEGFISLRPVLRFNADIITSNKEFCDCKFKWMIARGAFGESVGVTLPAYPKDVKTVYLKETFNVINAVSITCKQVLGSYVVEFER